MQAFGSATPVAGGAAFARHAHRQIGPRSLIVRGADDEIGIRHDWPCRGNLNAKSDQFELLAPDRPISKHRPGPRVTFLGLEGLSLGSRGWNAPRLTNPGGRAGELVTTARGLDAANQAPLATQSPGAIRGLW